MLNLRNRASRKRNGLPRKSPRLRTQVSKNVAPEVVTHVSKTKTKRTLELVDAGAPSKRICSITKTVPDAVEANNSKLE